MAKLKDFYKYNSFISLFLETKKYRGVRRKEFFLSFVLMIISLILIYKLYCYNTDQDLLQMIRNIINLLIPSFIGLLGFLIAGMSLMATIITKEVLRKIDEKDKIENIAGILYSFYLEGGIIGFNIIVLIYLSLIVYMPITLNFYCLMSAFFFVGFMVWFSILYAISLLGTCFNFFFMNMYYTEK